MSVKQIKYHIAVLAVTTFAALTILFALATVTSNAAEVVYDETTRTYTMSDSTYDKVINLDSGTTTTLDLSGYNRLTYGDGTYSHPCITGNGTLNIIGSGTLEVTIGQINCRNLMIGDGVKLLLGNKLFTNGNATIGKAEILSLSPKGNLDFNSYSGTSRPAIVFNNTTLNIGMYLYGETVLNDCNVTLRNSYIYSSGAPVTINGGTYNFIQDNENENSTVYLWHRTIVKNALIKANFPLQIQNLEMTDSTLEITMPPQSDYGYSFALYGENLIFVGSKVKIDGSANEGLYARDRVILTGHTNVDIKVLAAGIVAPNMEITHSGGKIQATDPAKAVAAITAVDFGYGSNATAGTLTLNKVYVKEPADGIVGKTTVKQDTGQDDGIPITTIMDGEVPAKTVVLETEHTTHTWDAGKVTKEPTETAEGVKTYTCTVCGATRTEAIPKLTPQGSQDSQGSQGSQASGKGEDSTPFGKGASAQAAEAAVLALPDDNDPAGTAFGLLQFKATKVTKNSIKLNWKAVPGASKYILFANKCGTGNKYKKLGEVTGTSFTATQAAGAAIQKGTYYKFMMIAADSQGKVISTSKTVHAATKGGKIGNHKKVTVKKSVTKKAKKLKKGKTLKLKAKAVPQAKKLKVRKHRGIMYESSNPAVAQVNGKGTVKGVGKGTCYIYAYAQNGTCAKVKVTVK